MLGRSTLKLGVILAVAAANLAANVAATAGEFRRLNLGGFELAWTIPVGGATRVLTYSIVRSSQIYPSAINCRGITSPAALIENSNIPLTAWRREIAAAFSMWEAVSNIRFLEVDNVSANILIGAQLDPTGWAFTNVDYDVRVPGDIKPITRALICLNPEKPWKTSFDGNLDVYDLRYTIAHEIGHALGLDHSGRKGSLMDFRYREFFREPQPGDVAGIREIYGEPKNILRAEGMGPFVPALIGTRQ